MRPGVPARGQGGADAIGERLAAELPEVAVTFDPDAMVGFEQDLTGRFAGRAAAVAQPRDTGEVAAVLRAARRLGLAVVPQGGNTGLVGGGVPRDGEVVLSLRGLGEVGAVDPDTAQIEVGAGATLAAVQDAAAEAGLQLPIDFGARSAATIGGMVATNAGGSLAVRYGVMRNRVAGLEAVLADGRVVRRMAGLGKDNAGDDLAQLLCGSEGTLGVITAARLQLVARPRGRLVVLLGLPDPASAVRLTRVLRGLPSLSALDHLDRACMELACAHLGIASPLASSHAVYLVVELAGGADLAADLAEALGDEVPEAATAVAEDGDTGRRIWRYREVLNEAIRALGPVLKLDIGLPLAELHGFFRWLEQGPGRSPGRRVFVYGHLGDGNLHVNLLLPEGKAPEMEEEEEAILRAATSRGGTISAEHGIGVAKRHLLHLCRGPAEIEAMWAIKRALDPSEMLSPGRVLPAAGA